MKRVQDRLIVAVLVGFAVPAFAAVNSGSTGADGPFTPAATTELQLPPSGIFNFTSVNIPSGVTVTFRKNAANTPVVILATGDVVVAGTINVSGNAAADSGTAGNGNVDDDGNPGLGGPGGYDGGAGGQTQHGRGGNGLGPGAGGGGQRVMAGCSPLQPYLEGGSGGGFGGPGVQGGSVSCGGGGSWGGPPLGQPYGTAELLALVGGSGGGGGTGSSFNYRGGGGGGGGGAILIASSATVNVTGTVVANGGAGGSSAGSGGGANGAGGSGGAIRIVAKTISGDGTINATGGGAGGISASGSNFIVAGNGGPGRIRLEGEFNFRTAGTSPGYSLAKPGPIFVPDFPTLRITSVAGATVPAPGSTNPDITLPANTANPVTVALASTGVPVGSSVSVKLTPAHAVPTTVVSPPLAGSTTNATTSVQLDLPAGPSVLQASVTYTITASLGDALGVQYAKGERVEKIEVAAGLNGPSTATLITVSGKRYPMPGPLPAMAGAG